MASSLRMWTRAAAVAALLAGVTVSATVSAAATSRAVHPLWSDALHVVAGPVEESGRALVMVVASDKTLHLEALESNGHVAWSEPYNASYITAGDYLTPVAIDGVALDLHPAVASTGSGLDSPRGIDVATGKVVWTRANVYAADVPVACEGGTAFCVDTVNASGDSYAVQVVNPRTGAKVAILSGIVRTLMPGLFQTSASKVSATAVSSSGARLWVKTFASLYGGPKFDPDGGWYFRSEGGLMVGSVGDIGTPTTTPTAVNVGDDRTIGVDPTTGAVQWRDPGMFACMGALPSTDPVICRYSGTVHYVDYQPSFAGVTLTLEGFSPRTGVITWSKRVTDVAPLSEGTADHVASDHELAVTLPGGAKVLLNLQTGATTSLASSTLLWCENANNYTTVVVTGDPYDGKKAGVLRFGGCTAAGTSSSVPATGSAWFGLRLGSEFVWPTPHGLDAAAIPSS